MSEAAKRRYLKDQEIQRDVYTHLANYFGGKFSQQEENESGEDYNSSQDLSGVCTSTYLLYHLQEGFTGSGSISVFPPLR